MVITAIVTAIIAFVLLIWVASGMNYHYLIVLLKADLRGMPLWFALLLFVPAVLLGPFAGRVIEPLLDRHYRYPEDEQ